MKGSPSKPQEPLHGYLLKSKGLLQYFEQGDQMSLRGGEGTVDWGAVGSNCSIENRLSSFKHIISSNNSSWQIWARWGFPTVSSHLQSLGLNTRNQNLRNHRGFPVAFSNGFSLAFAKEVDFSVVCSKGLSLAQRIFTWKFQWTFSGIFQRTFTFVRSGV